MEDQKISPFQVALVTGASRGIGKAIAKKLAHSGRYVYLNYHSNTKQAEQTLDEIISEGGKAELLQFDVTNTEDSEKAIEQIVLNHGQIDILVNNAGIRDDMLLVWMKRENWQKVLDTNLTGFFNVTRFAVKNMIQKRRGRIINITSTSGQSGVPGQVNYSASKAGLIGATQALAKEIAKRKITVNAVAPGFIETDMTEGLPTDLILKSIPAGRFGKPEEVAAAVLFLCSDEAAYITGQVIGINGGVF
ncbi:MAG: 3-oxoacyl-ACP reductase FabG [Proteobacteria bacterium]|nr:3-oxoacyl-ACP reductase FabG [Pseudomonadota bacterium]MBU4472069.1 3-oxoacyl-ACP reductase FabG [Pseudomonadota bacterium]MCG2752933.1 3-oxoacyl-ACP reductase FabG [Desulfobacteraceae bacterium]